VEAVLRVDHRCLDARETALLVEESQRQNVKLREVAEQLVNRLRGPAVGRVRRLGPVPFARRDCGYQNAADGPAGSR
jgi:hypothetical protein